MRIRHAVAAMISATALVLAGLPTLAEAGVARRPITGVGYVQGVGWTAPSVVIGSTGQSRALTAIRLDGYPVSYTVSVIGVGWTRRAYVGEVAGTAGGAQLQAIRIYLDPTAAEWGSIRYRCHVQGWGWGPWVADGRGCGNKVGLRLEAVEVQYTLRG